VLDEAFKSRIHYKIYYADLTRTQTLDIWQLNIDRVRKIETELGRVEQREPMQINDQELLAFADWLFAEGEKGRGLTRWNGRQIRNAFQVARSLAYYEHGLRLQEMERRRATAVFQPTMDDYAAVGPPRLEIRHFDTMRQLTAAFENYRQTIHGTTDAEMQLDLGARNDMYKDKLKEAQQAEYNNDVHFRGQVRSSQDGSAVAGQAAGVAGDMAIAATFAVSNMPINRPTQQVAGVGGDDLSRARVNNSSPTQLHSSSPNTLPHRGSVGSRARSNSYL
jgi:hypothetical protein